MPREMFELGETMDIEAGGVFTKTKVQDILDNDLFAVSQPTVKLVPIRIEPYSSVRFTFCRPTGIYTFQAELVERYSKDNLRLCLFRITTEIQKKQRRYGYRLPVILHATVRVLSGEAEAAGGNACIYKGKTINLSERGVLFSCFERFERGVKLMINLRLDLSDQLVAMGEVVRCEPPVNENEPFAIAVQFFNMQRKDQMRIGRYILKRQISDRKAKENENNFF